MAPTATYPTFPSDVPTHPLLIIDYELIKARDPKEIDRLWEAATDIGFWYMKNHGVDEHADNMFDVGAESLALPLEEKMKFEQGDDGMSAGFKVAGAYTTDQSGTPDTMEWLNVAQDDAFAYPKPAIRAYHPTTNARMASKIAPFFRQSLEVNTTILEVLNDRLGLPPGALLKRHVEEERSPSELRVTKIQPTPNTVQVGLGSHTDFGSMSYLYNRLGGLQVLVPSSDTWQYVKPIPGHVIANVGDTLALFSGGILRSNSHRVLAPPGPQTGNTRYSLVYFSRPNDTVNIRALVEDSPIIAEAVRRDPATNYDPGSTGLEWFSRRIKYHRVNNRTGPESWLANRGTEYRPLA